MKPNLFGAATTLLLTFSIAFSYGQNGSVVIQNNVNLPKDSVTSQLISSLNGFLGQKEKLTKENTFVLKDDLLETAALLDEMKGVEQNAKLKDGGFYKPYLTNITKRDNNNFIIQLSYIGIADNTPAIRASFKLLAKHIDGRFYFYSALKQNATSWKIKKAGYITYCYKDTLNAADTKEFQKMVFLYDKKLKANKPIVLYYCDNFLEVQQMLGVEYKADYAGIISNNLTANENGISLIVNGWNASRHRFDPHDLFHDRLRTVLSNDVINRPVDEGCAYLLGGSWGKSWTEILTLFKAYAKENPNADWLQLYIDAKNYSDDGGKILKVSYAINALIAQQLEKEKGFAAVMELLSCGKKEKGDENYFKALAKLTGINKADFNSKVWNLIKAS
ncbi:hypothetical protein [Mucilaginibacter sp.]|jgi:hypothetical protein|uniref:hypothetical protein n=1 Tax=Mucilaginibacter sp. TaxID=1882438 RepID=UPI00356564C9